MRHEIQTRRSLVRSALTLGAVSLAAILIMSYPLFQQEAVAHVDLKVTNTRIKVECTIGSYHGPCIIDTGMPMGFFVNKNATRGYPKPLLLIKYYGMTGHSGWGKVISLPITIGDKTVEVSGVLVDHKLEAPFIGLATLKNLSDCIAFDFAKERLLMDVCEDKQAADEGTDDGAASTESGATPAETSNGNEDSP